MTALAGIGATEKLLFMPTGLVQEHILMDGTPVNSERKTPLSIQMPEGRKLGHCHPFPKITALTEKKQ